MGILSVFFFKYSTDVREVGNKLLGLASELKQESVLYRFFFYSASWLKERRVYRLMLVSVFPQLDLVPLYASQQTSRSLSLSVSLPLPRARTS